MFGKRRVRKNGASKGLSVLTLLRCLYRDGLDPHAEDDLPLTAIRRQWPYRCSDAQPKILPACALWRKRALPATLSYGPTRKRRRPITEGIALLGSAFAVTAARHGQKAHASGKKWQRGRQRHGGHLIEREVRIRDPVSVTN